MKEELPKDGFYVSQKDIVNVDFKEIIKQGEVVKLTDSEFCSYSTLRPRLVVQFMHFGRTKESEFTAIEESKEECISLFNRCFKRIDL